MKIVHFKYQANNYWGIIDPVKQTIYSRLDQTSAFSDFRDVISFFNQNCLVDQLTDQVNRMEVELLAPVMPPKNILCIGKNYYDHILEFDGNDDDVKRIKEAPIFFSKAISSLTGPYSPMLSHEQITKELDYEAELAVVIGKEGINIEERDALSYVYGYAVLNDVTARDLQRNHQQWFKGKSLDSFCPVGPWIITKDEIEDPQDLAIKSIINGEVRQDSNTRMMIHSIASQISILSRGMSLVPGDVIATGTPKGVGMGYNPKRFLNKGDVVEVMIEKIGSLKNTVE